MGLIYEGRIEESAGVGAFGKRIWSTRYGVYDKTTRVLEIYGPSGGELLGSVRIREGTAKNKGKAGPLGRRFKTEVEVLPGEGADPMLSSFLAHSEVGGGHL